MAKKRTLKKHKWGVNIVLIILTLIFVLPMFTIIGVSFSNENDVVRYGYKLIPLHFDTTAYKLLFKNFGSIIRAYGVTIYGSVIGTFLSLLLMSTAGYALSRKEFRFRKFFTYYFLITMIFSGGLVPTYIINTKYLGLMNNMLVYVVTGLVAAYNIFIFRTFFQQIPVSLIEAAKIDGASERKIFTSIIFPMSKACFASLGFMTLLSRWNDFTVPMYYINDRTMYNIQYYLQMVIKESNFLKQALEMAGSNDSVNIPTETLKFAVCVIGALPAAILFPYFQKYFAKGMVIGSVKG